VLKTQICVTHPQCVNLHFYSTILLLRSKQYHDVLLRLPENVEMIMIQTIVLNVVHHQNYDAHNFFHPERKTVQHSIFEKKKNHTKTPSEYRECAHLPHRFILLHNLKATHISATINCRTCQILKYT